jgi:hypothetical protein
VRPSSFRDRITASRAARASTRALRRAPRWCGDRSLRAAASTAPRRGPRCPESQFVSVSTSPTRCSLAGILGWRRSNRARSRPDRGRPHDRSMGARRSQSTVTQSARCEGRDAQPFGPSGLSVVLSGIWVARVPPPRVFESVQSHRVGPLALRLGRPGLDAVVSQPALELPDCERRSRLFARSSRRRQLGVSDPAAWNGLVVPLGEPFAPAARRDRPVGDQAGDPGDHALLLTLRGSFLPVPGAPPELPTRGSQRLPCSRVASAAQEFWSFPRASQRDFTSVRAQP